MRKLLAKSELSKSIFQENHQQDLSKYRLKLTWEGNIETSHDFPTESLLRPKNSKKLHNFQQLRWFGANGLNLQGQRQLAIHVKFFFQSFDYFLDGNIPRKQRHPLRTHSKWSRSTPSSRS